MPPRLPGKNLWELVRRYVLGITDAQQRGYLLRLMIERRKEGQGNDQNIG